MNVERCFHSIGQGAFYTERLTSNNGDHLYNIIYDCGTLSSSVSLTDTIEDYYDTEERIDYIFISHFHEDHVNGVFDILNHCNVRNIVIPLMDTTDEIYVLIDNQYRRSINRRSFTGIQNFINTIRRNRRNGNETRVIQVRPYQNEGHDIGELLIVDDQLELDIEIDSGRNICLGDSWFLKPFNFRRNSGALEFQQELMRRNISLNNFIHNWRINRNMSSEMRQAYTAVTGSLNTNSLTLYSGDNTNVKGCLYLGDYDCSGVMKWRDLENCYNNNFDFIKTVQIPHHGSHHNFNSNLLSINQNTNDYVISCGSDNRYSHPHKTVLLESLRSRHLLNLVDENTEPFLENL